MNASLRYSIYGIITALVAASIVFIPIYSMHKSYQKEGNELLQNIQKTPTNKLYTLFTSTSYAPKTLYYGTLLQRFMDTTATNNDITTLKNNSQDAFVERFHSAYKQYLYSNSTMNSDIRKHYEDTFGIDFMDSWLLTMQYLSTKEARHNHYKTLIIDTYKPQQIVNMLSYMRTYEPSETHQNTASLLEKNMNEGVYSAFIEYLQTLHNAHTDALKYYREAYKMLPDSYKTALLDEYYNPTIAYTKEKRIGNIDINNTIKSDKNSLESIFEQYKIIAKTRDNDGTIVNFYDAEYRDLVFSGVYNTSTNRFLSINIGDTSYTNISSERLIGLLKSLSRIPAKSL